MITQRSSSTSRSHADGEACALPHAPGATGATRDGSVLGQTFAFALAHRDFSHLGTVLHREIEFRALTPRRTFEAASDEQTLEILRLWFGGPRVVDEVLGIDTDAFADRQSVAYRFAGHGPDGPFVIEQHAYYSERDGRIDWMRLVCSGFRAA